MLLYRKISPLQMLKKWEGAGETGGFDMKKASGKTECDFFHNRRFNELKNVSNET